MARFNFEKQDKPKDLPPSYKENSINNNIKAANWFIKKKTWLPGMSLKLSNGSASIDGTQGPPLYFMTFQPPMDSRMGNYSAPIRTDQGETQFEQELENQYLRHFQYANDYWVAHPAEEKAI
jgi:hypothetical protein